MLGLQPRELMRDKESEYRESGADNEDLTREQLIELMVRFPKLIERPIVVSNGKAAIGRPPERVLDIL
jgi:arsenate reductase